MVIKSGSFRSPDIQTVHCCVLDLQCELQGLCTVYILLAKKYWVWSKVIVIVKGVGVGVNQRFLEKFWLTLEILGFWPFNF